ncbi:penicillin-binding protein 2 [Acidiphilium acidophilum]|uniref:peptidoglycan D,D-transpeptidase FtsI family protein n=1 Tax=Acidiphilium acidophilum TaxID=76588 RepID=UPI002E8E754C|nr:penicillin-binding protein 2 [Acidiphilium acidophilum]
MSLNRNQDRAALSPPPPIAPRWFSRFKGRARFGMAAFILIYALLALKLIDATIIAPIKPSAAVLAAQRPDFRTMLSAPDRAPILDRNGRILAVSLPGAALFADPKEITTPKRDAARLETALPMLNQAEIAHRLGLSHYGFVYLDRDLTAAQELAVNRLGIPGLYFQHVWVRHYPEGNLAAHVLGGVTPDQRGIAGIEDYFDRRLIAHPTQPLRLSIDLRVEAIVHREVARAMADYKARGACGIVENMSGRVVAMVSLPDYNANDLHDAPTHALFDRCISGDYEPGSVMKLMTMPAALQSRLVDYWDRFNTTHPLFVDGFSVTDYEPVHYWLAMPAILAFSSNIGASRIATIMGSKIQRAWLRKMGFFKPSPIQMPGVQPPIWHPKDTWKLLTTMTVSFGNGIAMAPIILVNAVVADVNGGILYKPTLLARTKGAPPRTGIRVMRHSVSVTMRRLMRGVVLSGTGVYARVPGYLVGGKTGTSQVVGRNGSYRNHLNNSSFMAMFPATDPRYVVYVLVIHPKPTKKMQHFSYGFTTGGYVAAPAVGRIIARIGPMLGIPPVEGPALKAINARFGIPLKPAIPPGQPALGPENPFPPGANRYAYILANRTPPKHPDTEAAAAALHRVQLATPGQRTNDRGPVHLPALMQTVASGVGQE